MQGSFLKKIFILIVTFSLYDGQRVCACAAIREERKKPYNKAQINGTSGEEHKAKVGAGRGKNQPKAAAPKTTAVLKPIPKRPAGAPQRGPAAPSHLSHVPSTPGFRPAEGSFKPLVVPEPDRLEVSGGDEKDAGGKSFEVMLAELTRLALREPRARGIVVVLFGTSSSGKTTLLKALKKLLDRSIRNPEEWLMQGIDEIQEQEIDSLSDVDTRRFPDVDDINIAMIKRIISLTSKGFNVVCDTVLDLKSKEFVNFCKAMQRHTTVLTVLVYCPLSQIEERVMRRSTPSPDHDETRSLIQPIDQFGKVYGPAESHPGTPPLDMVSLRDIQQLRGSPLLEGKDENMVGRYFIRLEEDLGFAAGKAEVLISPRNVLIDLTLHSNAIARESKEGLAALRASEIGSFPVNLCLIILSYCPTNVEQVLELIKKKASGALEF